MTLVRIGRTSQRGGGGGVGGGNAPIKVHGGCPSSVCKRQTTYPQFGSTVVFFCGLPRNYDTHVVAEVWRGILFYNSYLGVLVQRSWSRGVILRGRRSVMRRGPHGTRAMAKTPDVQWGGTEENAGQA